MKSKKILIVSQYFYPEPFRINDIAFSLAKRGHEVSVITGIPNYPSGKTYPGYSLFKKRKEIVNQVSIQRLFLIARGNHSLKLLLNYASFYVALTIKMFFMKKKYDVVFAFEVSPMIQVSPITWYTRRKNIPLISYLQDIWPESLEMVGQKPKGLILKWIEKKAYKIYHYSDKILIPSLTMKHWIKNVYPNHNHIYEWPQYAESFYQPKEKIVLNDFKAFDGLTLMFTGNIGRAQGLDELIERLIHYNGTHNKKYRVLLIGDGRAKRELIEKVNESNLNEIVYFLDRKDPEEIPNYLAYADITYLSFSGSHLFEQMIPAKLQSYMACGKPVLVNARGISAKIINESQSGFIMNDSSQETFNDIFNQVLNAPKSMLKSMGKNALIYAKKHFHKETLLDTLEREYLS